MAERIRREDRRLAQEAEALRRREEAQEAAALEESRKAAAERAALATARTQVEARAEAAARETARAAQVRTEAEAVLAIAEAVATGEIVMGEDAEGELVPRQATAAPQASRDRTEAALGQASAKRLLQRITQGARRMAPAARTRAEAQAEAKIVAQAARLAAAEAEAERRRQEAETREAEAGRTIRAALRLDAAARLVLDRIRGLLTPGQAAALRETTTGFEQARAEAVPLLRRPRKRWPGPGSGVIHHAGRFPRKRPRAIFCENGPKGHFVSGTDAMTFQAPRTTSCFLRNSAASSRPKPAPASSSARSPWKPMRSAGRSASPWARCSTAGSPSCPRTSAPTSSPRWRPAPPPANAA